MIRPQCLTPPTIPRICLLGLIQNTEPSLRTYTHNPPTPQQAVPPQQAAACWLDWFVALLEVRGLSDKGSLRRASAAATHRSPASMGRCQPGNSGAQPQAKGAWRAPDATEATEPNQRTSESVSYLMHWVPPRPDTAFRAHASSAGHKQREHRFLHAGSGRSAATQAIALHHVPTSTECPCSHPLHCRVPDQGVPAAHQAPRHRLLQPLAHRAAAGHAKRRRRRRCHPLPAVTTLLRAGVRPQRAAGRQHRRPRCAPPDAAVLPMLAVCRAACCLSNRMRLFVHRSSASGRTSSCRQATLRALSLLTPHACQTRLRPAYSDNLQRVHAAGVWEEPRDAYLHEVLIRRRGTPAAMAVLLYGTFQQLFLDGAIDFMVRIDCRCGPCLPPRCCWRSEHHQI